VLIIAVQDHPMSSRAASTVSYRTLLRRFRRNRRVTVRAVGSRLAHLDQQARAMARGAQSRS